MARTAIIIGAGFGGLALGIRLQAQGFQVTIFEKNKRPGGHAYPKENNGFKFDLGPSLITAPDIISDIFHAAGKRMEDYLEMLPLDPFYRIYFHDHTFIDYQGDTEKMKAQMAKFSAKDAANYEKFIAHAGKVHHAVIDDGLGKQPFYWRTLFKFIPQALKLRVPWPAYRVVKKYFKDPHNLFTFSFNTLFIGGNPFRAPGVYLMIPYLEKTGGVWYTRGGMFRFVEALERVFRELGGDLRLNQPVSEINVAHGQAKGVKTGSENHLADLVVSNAHFAHTHLELIPAAQRRYWTDTKVKRMDYSMSAFVIYLGTRRQYPQLLHHTLIIAKRYRELIGDIFDRKILADDFSLYCHTPTRTDASLAPAGGESMYFLAPVPNLASKIDWQAKKEKFANKILDFLEHEFGLTDLRKNIEIMEIFTPDDYEKHCNDYLGSAWGLEPKLTQTATFRPHNRHEEIKNFYLVGTSTHPGAGIPGVLLTAEATANAIFEDFQ